MIVGLPVNAILKIGNSKQANARHESRQAEN